MARPRRRPWPSSLRASVFSRGVGNSAWATNFLRGSPGPRSGPARSILAVGGGRGPVAARARMDRSAWASATSASCASPRRDPAAHEPRRDGLHLDAQRLVTGREREAGLLGDPPVVQTGREAPVVLEQAGAVRRHPVPLLGDIGGLVPKQRAGLEPDGPSEHADQHPTLMSDPALHLVARPARRRPGQQRPEGRQGRARPGLPGQLTQRDPRGHQAGVARRSAELVRPVGRRVHPDGVGEEPDVHDRLAGLDGGVRAAVDLDLQVRRSGGDLHARGSGRWGRGRHAAIILSRSCHSCEGRWPCAVRRPSSLRTSTYPLPQRHSWARRPPYRGPARWWCPRGAGCSLRGRAIGPDVVDGAIDEARRSGRSVHWPPPPLQ